MDKLLPEVSKDTISKLTREVIGDKDTMVKTTKLIKEENPNLAAVLLELAETTESPNIVMYTGLAVYNLLRSQAEADKLEEDFLVE